MNNPPAFPDGLGNRGMTLRDYFAVKAMQALIDKDEWQSTVREVSEDVALKSYAMADAMMKAREA